MPTKWTVCHKYAYKVEEVTAEGAYCDVGLVPGGVLPSPPGSCLGRAGGGGSGGVWGLCPVGSALPVWATASLPTSAPYSHHCKNNDNNDNNKFAFQLVMS